jgi:hypothetical protein
MKAMGVWSEYAACRSSAVFRPEAVDEFEGTFCCAVEEAFEASCAEVARYRTDRKPDNALAGILELFGDVLVHAGYFLGHLDGLDLAFSDNFPKLTALFQKHPKLAGPVVGLRRILEELWLGEPDWTSIEVFVPIYDLIIELLSLQGLELVNDKGEWRPALIQNCNGSAH